MTLETPGVPSIYSDVAATVVLDNARVIVQRLELAPGQSTGRPRYHGEHLQVFIRGGVLADDATGRRSIWRDGRVMWRGGAPDPRDAGVTNAGAQPIEMVWITLKPVAPARRAAGQGAPKYAYLNYPAIAGEDLLENEHVIVQRFVVPPGQWEGVHAHHPDMLYVHVRGGQWGARAHGEPAHPDGDPVPDGDVGWMPVIDLSVGHEAGNLGPAPIDLIWVTLKN